MDIRLAILHLVYSSRNCHRHSDLPTYGQGSLHEEGKSVVHERNQDAVYYTCSVRHQLLNSMALGHELLGLQR